MRDDRVFPGTRRLGAVIVPFLVVAFALLYVFPDDTRHWFAWDVQPTIRITLESQLIGLGLILLGTIRAWDDLDTSNPIAYVFVAGIAGLFVSLLTLEWYMVGRTRASLPPLVARGNQVAPPAVGD